MQEEEEEEMQGALKQKPLLYGNVCVCVCLCAFVFLWMLSCSQLWQQLSGFSHVPDCWYVHSGRQKKDPFGDEQR